MTLWTRRWSPSFPAPQPVFRASAFNSPFLAVLVQLRHVSILIRCGGLCEGQCTVNRRLNMVHGVSLKKKDGI